MVKRVGLFTALLLFAASASAELKIAVLNVELALTNTEEFKTEDKKLMDETKAEQDTLKKLGSDINAMTEKYKKDSEVMSDTEKRKAEKEIEDKQIDYQFRGKKLEKTVNDRRQEVARQLAPRLDAVLKDLISTEKYDLILPRQAVAYLDPKLDITARVTELLNQKK